MKQNRNELLSEICQLLRNSELADLMVLSIEVLRMKPKKNQMQFNSDCNIELGQQARRWEWVKIQWASPILIG